MIGKVNYKLEIKKNKIFIKVIYTAKFQRFRCELCHIEDDWNCLIFLRACQRKLDHRKCSHLSFPMGIIHFGAF